MGTLLVSAVPTLAWSRGIHAGGGWWDYGVGSCYVWSYYSHNGRSHSSTAIGKYKIFSGWMNPGYPAKASAKKSLWGGNQAYFNYR